MDKKLLFRLAGGAAPCPAEVRAAAHRLVVGGRDPKDIKTVVDYIKQSETQET